jgi:hypothetical protein
MLFLSTSNIVVDIAKKNNRTMFPPKNSEKIHILIILIVDYLLTPSAATALRTMMEHLPSKSTRCPTDAVVSPISSARCPMATTMIRTTELVRHRSGLRA